MTWQFFAVLASFLWANTNVLDKYIMSKYVRRSRVPLLVDSAAGLVVGVFLLFITQPTDLSWHLVALGCLAGIIALCSTMLYFWAVQRGEISALIPMLYFVPFFVALLAAVFLGEIFAPVRYLGVAALVVGAMTLTYQKGRIHLQASVLFILIAAFLWAVASVIEKGLVTAMTPLAILGLTRLGAAFTLPALVVVARKEFVWTMRTHGPKALAAMLLSEILGTSAELALFTAFALGPLTLVSALTSLQPFFVLVIVAVFGIFWPNIIERTMTKKEFTRKILGVIVMAFGAFLVT